MPELDEERRRHILERLLAVFENRLEEAQFLEHYNSLADRRLDFSRACRLYQNAMQCLNCNSEIARDIEIAILCSSIESISGGHHIVFKDWLIEHRLVDLSNRSEAEIQAALNRYYAEYIEGEADREGIFYNFRRFLLENCPEELKQAPIMVIRRNQPSRQATFEESLDYVYSRFRSLFLHTGVGRATTRPLPGFEHAFSLGTFLGDWHRRRGWSVHTEQVVEWFGNVVRESLFHFLIQ